MSETYDSTRGDSWLSNMWGGFKTGAMGGALFGGIGAIPGAIGGAIAGAGKSLVDTFSEVSDRKDWKAEHGEELAPLYRAADDNPEFSGDIYNSIEEQFYGDRETRLAEEREDQGVLGDIWDWMWE